MHGGPSQGAAAETCPSSLVKQCFKLKDCWLVIESCCIMYAAWLSFLLQLPVWLPLEAWLKVVLPVIAIVLEFRLSGTK
jgi:hypothetical protein